MLRHHREEEPGTARVWPVSRMVDLIQPDRTTDEQAGLTDLYNYINNFILAREKVASMASVQTLGCATPALLSNFYWTQFPFLGSGSRQAGRAPRVRLSLSCAAI